MTPVEQMPIEQAIAQTERYLEALERERDDVAALLLQLRELAKKPALILDERPRRFVNGPPARIPSVRPLPPLPVAASAMAKAAITERRRKAS